MENISSLPVLCIQGQRKTAAEADGCPAPVLGKCGILKFYKNIKNTQIDK